MRKLLFSRLLRQNCTPFYLPLQERVESRLFWLHVACEFRPLAHSESRVSTPVLEARRAQFDNSHIVGYAEIGVLSQPLS
jgi:hypothetical protein